MRFLVFLFLLSPMVAQASSSASSSGGISYSIQPIAGFDTVYRNTPSPHTVTRSIYGARLVAGKDFLSLEAEYSKASDTESYTTAPQTILNNDELIKVGLQSTLHLGPNFFFTARAGGQTDNNSNDSTSNGVVIHTTTASTYPYGGAELGFHLGSVFSLAVGTTVVFVNTSDMSKNEYQNTIVLNLSIHPK
jgi:hypothetical protein